MRTPRSRIATWIGASALAGGLLMSAGGVAQAIPGDPTASECAVIAAQAVLNNRTPEAELAAQGGGNCVFAATTTTAATVLAVTVVPKSKLPGTGSDIRQPLTMGAVAVGLGGAIVLINRRRAAAPE